MKKVLIIIPVVLCVAGVLWVAKAWTLRKADDKVTMFNSNCDTLILGLQQYKEFVGSYPTGNNAAIVKALSGRTEKKVIILAIRNAKMNDKGEVLDPWSTPLRFYFANDEVLIRSAGPDKVWEDAASPNTDDLYRSVGKEK
jgi:hypothetical protein